MFFLDTVDCIVLKTDSYAGVVNLIMKVVELISVAFDIVRITSSDIMLVESLIPLQ